MEVAVEWDSTYERGELVVLLAKFTGMPDHIKLFHLSKLMNKGQLIKAKDREEFKKILSSLPVELVNLASIGMSYFLSGEHHQCAR